VGDNSSCKNDFIYENRISNPSFASDLTFTSIVRIGIKTSKVSECEISLLRVKLITPIFGFDFKFYLANWFVCCTKKVLEGEGGVVEH